MRVLLLLLGALFAWSVSAASNSLVDELGLTLLPVTALADDEAPLVVFMSGDGGWAPLDKGVSARLKAKGIPVVGWNSLTYYWKKKDPDKVTADLKRILDLYMPRWKTKRWALIGFSFGAEIVPFAINRLPEEYRKKMAAAVLLSPSTTSDFEIHVSQFVSNQASGHYMTLPELSQIKDVPMVCFFGQEDQHDNMLCPNLKQPNVTVIALPGGHHYNDDYDQITGLILSHLPFLKK